MAAQEWIISAFTFAFGCCIGSFLNVVIYRLPREKSLVSPGSACPGCGKPIRFYDNIPLISWLVLRARCRHCGTGISPRYFIVELLTGLVFLGLYLVYFHSAVRLGMQAPNGWFVYLVHVILLAALIAGSGIDLELWIIPLSICWFATAVGFVGSAVGGYLIDPEVVRTHSLLPVASPTTGALALGAGIGLAASLLLLKAGLLKRSYEIPETGEKPEPVEEKPKVEKGAFPFADDPEFNHRLEAMREIVFLTPVIVGAIVANAVLTRSGPLAAGWAGLLEVPAVAGFLGSFLGYFVGCAVVWATRVLGTLAFGKEAMGLGDVHLMGAAGAVIGPVMVVVAFFVAPFFGLGWALFQMVFKKIRQIPYGPFLSFAVLTVMILHDWILKECAFLFLH
ncbi:prepilin peptidase [Anaerobaca lacustris]|uniref:Prepilin peptidase n=1 Tax=Anaerobaca lacustris TaxID=3044600 RepID=A0AAW6TYB8_9BACT|nr:prepilin peptidase [Sedimentisphaerales bacterium M17dextr]